MLCTLLMIFQNGNVNKYGSQQPKKDHNHWRDVFVSIFRDGLKSEGKQSNMKPAFNLGDVYSMCVGKYIFIFTI